MNLRPVMTFFDWRFFLSVGFCALALATVLALDDAGRSRATADTFAFDVKALQRVATQNAELIGELNAKADALAEQVRQLNGIPVVLPDTSTTRRTTSGSDRPQGSARPPATGAPSQPSPAPPARQPPASNTTIACLPILGRCV